MKQITFMLTTAIIALGFTGNALAQEGKSFTCTNKMYREATFDYSTDSVSIKDTNIEGKFDIAEHIIKNLKQDIQFSPISLKLVINREKSNCVSPSTFEVDCTQAETGHLELTGITLLSADKEVHAITTLHIPVNLKSFHLNSGIEKIPGHTDVDNKNHMMVTAEADVEVDGKTFNLNWGAFFYTTSDTLLASCRVQN